MSSSRPRLPHLSAERTAAEPFRRARLRDPKGPLGPVPPRLIEGLRGDAPVPEEAFDELLDHRWRPLSRVHWTPIEVCRLAALWLKPLAGESVLDVGCGVGKFCVVASMVSPGEFVGVEQRPQLVAQARAVAKRVGSPARFIQGSAFTVDWRRFSCLYFYNPFDEVREGEPSRIDGSLGPSDALFRDWVALAQQKLEQLAAGTRVVTFHGMGGAMPSSYRMVEAEHVADGMLQLWVRESPASGSPESAPP